MKSKEAHGLKRLKFPSMYKCSILELSEFLKVGLNTPYSLELDEVNVVLF